MQLRLPSTALVIAGLLVTNVCLAGQLAAAGGTREPTKGLLYCPANPDNPTFRAEVSAALGGLAVDYFDARIATPTVEQMQEYRAVFTWENYSYNDRELMGNRLAEFVDLGGRVIMGQWATPTGGSTEGGIWGWDYFPATSTSYSSGSYMGDGTDCVHQGIAEYYSQYLDHAYVREGFMSDGTMSTGTLAVAWRPDRRVYYSPGNTGASYGTGQWAQLTANIVLCTDEPIYVACCDPYTGECADEVAAVDCAPLQIFWQTSCAELDPPCGNPGCCCIDDSAGVTVEYQVNCDGRFLPGVLGQDCATGAFDPPCGDYLPCQHSITMWDDYGDGWNNGYIDVYVAGELVAAGVTLASGAGPGYAYFEAATGDEITTVWTAGGWPYEASYCIYAVTGAELGCDGMGGVDPTGITVYGYCGEPGACCNPYTGECEDDVVWQECLPPLQHFGIEQCAELDPPCGNPGCCCMEVWWWCDLNNDGVVDTADLNMLYLAFGSQAGGPGWLPTADYDGDGRITLVDWQAWRQCYTGYDEGAGAVYVELEANCGGRFLGGVLDSECSIDAFYPPCGEWEPVGTLYCPSQQDNAAFRAEVSAITGSPCDYYDARLGTPSLELLLQYECVLTWCNYPYADRFAMGDRLADYVDAGGHVILGQWTLHTTHNSWLEGRIMTADYLPVTATSYVPAGTTYTGDGVGCEFAGIAALQATYCDLISLRPGPFWGSGTWTTGTLVAGWRLDKGVTYAAGHTGMNFSTGDWAQFTVNLCSCSGGPAYGACCDIYTGDCADGVDLQDCHPPLQFHYQKQCAELEPPCGNPGCCCERPESGEITDPHFSYALNCDGRFLPGVLSDDCVTEAFTPPCGQHLVCEHTARMWDDYGDGWNGGYIDIYVNGELAAAGVTLASGAGPLDFVFEAATGAEITTVYTAGSWAYENSYCIYAVTGAELGCDGLGGVDPVGITVYGYCGEPGACCDPYTGECTDEVVWQECLPPLQHFAAEECAELNPPCGNPGCCCDEDAGVAYEEFAANCARRFVAGVTGEDCTIDPFDPPCGEWQPVGILYCPSQPDNAAFRAAVTALSGSPCDYYDARVATPSLAMLQEYECVLTWVNYAYADKDAMGNVLADFVDVGGHVVLGQWCLPTAGNYLGGRIMTDDYCPTTASTYTSATYMGDGFGCWFWGVSLLSATYCDQMSLRPGPTFGAGTWSTGTLVAGWRLDKRVRYASGHTGGSYSVGDWAQFTVNLCGCYVPSVAGACCDPYTGICTENVPVMSCWPPLQFHWQKQCAELDPPCGDPGACCDIYTGDCWDPVLRLNCEYARFESGGQCDELNPPCGTPGCCCVDSEYEVSVEYEANCNGRFLPGVLGEACDIDAFDPPCGSWHCAGLLYAPSNPDNATFRNQLAALLGQRVDYFDARVATPTLNQIKDYCYVLTWANYPYADNVAMGDVLADFADIKYYRRVILGQWCLPTADNYLAGRIMTAAYCPGTASSYASGSYMLDGQDCVHVLGPVGAYGGSYNDIVTPIAGVFWDGTVSHGGKAVVWRPDRRVYYSAGHTGLYYTTGDWVQLTYNMCICSSPPLGACCNVETGECQDYVVIFDCAAYPLEWHHAPRCDQLDPPCGNPGCCCDDYAAVTFEELAANCSGRFLPGVLGDDCAVDAFNPPCGEYFPCQHSIAMWDDYGDGWNDGYIDVYVGGILVLEGLTLSSGAGPGYAHFQAEHGEEITTVWTPGGWPYEASYCIYGYDGSELGCDGLDGVDPTGITVYGSCQEPVCGNGICQPSENCVTCPEDCGECECISQLPNQSNGVFSDIDCDFCSGDIQILAEQFIMWEETTVVGVNCWGGYYPDDTPTAEDAFTLIFRNDAGGLPGAEIAKFGPLVGTRSQTGVVLFGVHEYLHELPVNLQLAAGTYWIELFNDTSGSTESWFWEAGNRDPTEGIAGQAYTFSAYPSESWSFDSSTDMAFELICE
jgi:hypothetical protein